VAGTAVAVASASNAFSGTIANAGHASVVATAHGGFTRSPFTARCGTPYVTWSVGQVTRRGPSAELALV
jgi:hypothetical protein